MKKILIIRLSSIGDIVLTTPVPRCLKKQLPGVEIHFLTKGSFFEVLKENPYVDKVWNFGDDFNSLMQDLKKEKFDFIADLHHNLRSQRVRLALGVKSKAINKLNIEKWLMVNFKINRLPEKHIVDRYMETVSDLNVTYDGEGLDFFIKDSDEVQIQSLGQPWSNGYVGFVIGAKHATKRLPESKIEDIIREMKLPVVLLGGKEDATVAESLQNKFPEFVINACGKFRLAQSASLVKQARFIITHDTGLMHIAAAFNQRIISVWGNTIPGFGMTPFLSEGKGDSVIIENNNLDCRPCSKIGFNKCPKGHFRCMLENDVKSIVNQSFDWWKQESQ